MVVAAEAFCCVLSHLAPRLWPLMFSSDTTKDLVIFPVCMSAKVRKRDSIVSNISHLFVTKVIIYYLPNYEIRESDTNKVTKLNQKEIKALVYLLLFSQQLSA